MKNLFSVSASRQIGTKHIFRIGSIDSGRAATKEMAAQPDPVPVDLTNYFAKVKKGEYFSITKRTEMKANPEAKKGVAALQQVLKDGGLFDAAEAELKNADSEFRKAIEKIEAVAGKKLFGYSLAAFDKNQKLSQSSDGDYGHSTRLGVAYLQWKYGAKVDGAFGSETMALIKIDTLDKKLQEEPTNEDLQKLKVAVAKENEKTEEKTTPVEKVEKSVEVSTMVGAVISQNIYKGGQTLYDKTGKSIGTWPAETAAEIVGADAGAGGKYEIKFKNENEEEVTGYVWKRQKIETVPATDTTQGSGEYKYENIATVVTSAKEVEQKELKKQEEEKDVEKAKKAKAEKAEKAKEKKEKEKAVASKVKTFVEDDLRPGQCEKVETITFDGGKVLIGKERNPDKFATWDRSVVDSTDVYKNRDDELKKVIIGALREHAGE